MRGTGACQREGINRRSVLLLATLVPALVLALAGQASAATLGSVIVSDPAFPDYCGHSYEIRYEGQARERNDAQFTAVQSVDAPGLTPGPICWKATPDQVFVTDLSARISAGGPICTNFGPQAAECSAFLIVGLVVNTYDNRDLVKIGPENPPAVVSAGTGNDAVNAANGRGGDRISCGPGDDGATGDRRDHIDADCEKITRLG